MNLLDQQDNQAPANGAANQAPPAPSSPAPTNEGSGVFGGGLKVSLMPEDESQQGSGLRRWLIILFAVLFLQTIATGGGYLYLSNLEANRAEERVNLEQQINKVGTEIKQAQAEAAQAAQFAARAQIADSLLDDHLFWTNFFKYLGSKTKKNVTYLNFAGDIETQTISIDAIAKTYRDVAEQIVALREDEAIEEVITTSATARLNEKGALDGVGFSLLINMQPEVWLQPEAEPTSENQN